MEQVLQDLRHSARLLLKRPGFSLAVILTLALGIGANTAIFSVVDAALLRNLPYKNPDAIMHLWEKIQSDNRGQREASYPDFIDWQTQNHTFESIAGYGQAGLILNGAESTEFMEGGRVTADFFHVLGVDPVIGRTISHGDDAPGAPRVVVLSFATWNRRFGSDREIVGKNVTLSGAPFTVAGVLPASFHFAPLGDAEVFVPMNPSAEIRSRRFMHFVRVIGRLKDGVTKDQSQADMNLVAAQISQNDPQFHANTGLTINTLQNEIVGNVKQIVLVLLIAVTFVLLIACANVANLFLVRSTARQKEIAVRVALGASRWQLARQLMIESLLLSIIGGAIGVAIASWSVSLLVATIPRQQLAAMPYLQELGINGRMLGYSMLLAALAGVVFTLVPLFRIRLVGLHSTLKDGARNTAGVSRSRLRSTLVTVEVALTVMLAIGVGLMLKSTLKLLNVNPGFDARNLVTMRVILPGTSYADAKARVAFERRLTSELRTIPGVKNAATTGKLPLTGGGDTGTPTIDGHSSDRVNADASLRTVSAEYFDTVGVPLLTGRKFSDQDTLDRPRAAVVNQSFVQTFLPNQYPLNHQVSFAFDSSGKPWNIIGIVADENVNTLESRVTPVIYFPYSQDAEQVLNIVVRTTAEPTVVAETIREQIKQIDRSLPVFAVSTMEQIINDAPSTFARRFPTLLIGIFAGLAMLLAGIGLYGVVSYSVSQRTHELGVRIALGAQKRDIFRLVLGHGLMLAIVGVAVGLAASFVLTRFLSSLLFEVSPNDLEVIGAVVPLMLLLSIAASYCPTKRAAKVDPLVALRYE
jgi:predicted permease